MFSGACVSHFCGYDSSWVISTCKKHERVHPVINLHYTVHLFYVLIDPFPIYQYKNKSPSQTYYVYLACMIIWLLPSSVYVWSTSHKSTFKATNCKKVVCFSVNDSFLCGIIPPSIRSQARATRARNTALWDSSTQTKIDPNSKLMNSGKSGKAAEETKVNHC